MEFLDAWKNIKRPLGESWIDLAWRQSADAAPAPEAVAQNLDGQTLRFASFVRQLQILSEGKPFFLSPYQVKPLFGHKSPSTVCYFISGLCECGILTQVSKGDRVKKLASTYRYNFQPKATQ